MSVTLKDIAEELGVSVTTVSRALTGRGRVSPQTRQQVMEKASELGYNFASSGNSTAQSSICVVFNARLHSLSADPFYSTVMVGVENECQKYGSKVFFQTIDKPHDTSLWELHERGQLDGLILVGADVFPSVVEQAKSLAVPVVLVDNWLPDLPVDCVVTDNRGGIMRLVNYLVSQGHERIGFIGGPLSHRSLQERYDGYRAALRENGIARKHEWGWIHAESGPQADKGREGMEALIERGLPVTALITDNDSTALGVLQACAAAGIKVPKDLSLVGFDNVKLSEYVNPPLTTVHIHKRRMGAMAARRLHELITGQDADVPLRITLGTELVIRDSVRPLSK
ncbi:MAG: LacI family DNA-binding transcriptional regulator [Bacillota bacterium]|jgi:LacI family transcriptional regulator|nr:LacI family DNA-binding transcriptional regulator [Bacillota bacterium]NLJ02711.1 LacI family transcriptional regulator [Bacillota bacterium]